MRPMAVAAAAILVAAAASDALADAAPAGGMEAALAAYLAAEPAAPAPDPWKSQLELGLNGTGGNSRSFDFHAGATTEQETESRRWKFDARYDNGRSGGELTRSRLTAGARRDWILEASRWSPFAEARYDRDQFTAWTQRATVAAGAGYQWVKTERLSLRLRLGGAGTKEWGSEDSEHVRPEGLLGAEWAWKISASQELEASTVWYPDLSDFPEYRLVSAATWKVRLDEPGGVSLKFGVEHELDTHRVRPFHRQDVRYFAVLLVDF